MKTRAHCPFAWRLILSLFCIGVFGLPCGADDTPAVKNLLENGGLEGELDPATSLPAGWVVTQKPQSDYKVEVVDGGRTGKKCLRIHGEGKNVQIRLKHLPMNPDQRLVIAGWMKVTGGAGTVSLMHQYVDAKGRGLGSMSIGGVNAQQTDWTQTASIDHLQFTRPGMAIDADFIISAGGKIDALVDDLEAFALPVTPKDLLWGMGDFESHFNRSTPSVFKTESSPAGKVETSPDDNRPANGRLCLRVKANADWATAVLRRPVEYEAGKAYALTGKARVNSGRAGIRIDFYKGNTLTDLLGSSAVDATESKEWQALSVESPKDVPAGTTHITVTAICYGDAEAFWDQLVLLDGSTKDKPQVAAAIAKIEALGGQVERANDAPEGPVVALVLIDCEMLKDDDLEMLASFPGLQRLYLGRTSTSDAALKHIAGLKDLRVLGLAQTKVTDSGMKELVGLQKLETLVLAGTAITDEGLKELSKLKGLKDLRLSGTKTTDAGVTKLEESLPGLRTLTGRQAAQRPVKSAVRPGDKPEVTAAITKIEALGGEVQRADDTADAEVVSVDLIGNEQLRDEDLSVLKSLRGLRQLYLGRTATTDAGLEHITGLTELTFLGLIGTKVTDAGMKHLAGLPKLEVLFLLDTAVTNAGLKDLSKVQSLQQLLLPAAALTDASLQELGKLQNLWQLDLGQSKVTDEGLKQLEGLTNLDELSLSGTAITNDGLKLLGRLRSLSQLDLSETQINDEGLPSLTSIGKLAQLDISRTQITDAGLKELANLKQLKSLSVADAKTTDAGLKALKELLPDVRVSRVRGGGGGGGQRPDPDFDVLVAQPAYTETHPSVLFDEAHHNFHTSSGRYKAFADLVSNDGYRVAPNLVAITPESLAGHNVLVIANALAGEWAGRNEAAGSAFTEAECEAIQKWVEAGGALLLITDHEPFGSAAEELGKRFGVEMGKLTTVDPPNETQHGLLFTREKDQLGDHPIMNGRGPSEKVDHVRTFTGQSLKGPPGSAALLKFADTATEGGRGESVSAAGRAQGVALKQGRGRVVVMGEAAQLSAQIVGNPPQPLGMNVPDCDNRRMALNVMHWLSGLID